MVKEVIKKKENENGWINYFKNKYFTYTTNDNDINNALVAFVVKEGILFLDFDENDNKIDNKKRIIIINKKGFYYKFSFNKDEIKHEDNNNINLNLDLEESVQWI